MTQTAPLATIFGGSGFVGRYVTQRMARRGWRVRVAVRRPNEAMFVKPYGDVGQVEPVQANLRDGPSTAKVCEGATAVINCVGILAEAGPQKFDSVQAQGAERAAVAAKAAGAERFVQISAIGADADSDSLYAKSKAQGEAAVLAQFPDAAILRPSIVFGTEDQFFNRFAAMARFTPVLPLVGARTKFQPVHVEDVAEAAARCATGETPGGIYELGGPRVATFRELMELMLETVRRRRLIADLPLGAANFQAKALTMLEKLSGGLWRNDLLTEDQIKLLGRDNVVGEGVKTFTDLAIEPKAMEAVLESYLWPYRPGGQYARITESAKKLRG